MRSSQSAGIKRALNDTSSILSSGSKPRPSKRHKSGDGDDEVEIVSPVILGKSAARPPPSVASGSRSPTPQPIRARKQKKRRQPLPCDSDSDSDLPDDIFSSIPKRGEKSKSSSSSKTPDSNPKSTKKTRELKPPVPGYKRPRVTVPLGHFEISDDDKQPGPSRRPAPPRSQSGKGSSSSATAPPTTEIIDLCSDAEPESPVCNKRPDIRTANEGGTIVILTSEDETAPPSIPIEAARRNRQRPRPTPSQRKRRSAPISPPHEEAPPLSQLFSPAPSPVSTTPATAAISTSAFTTLPRLSFTGTQRQASLELSGSESEGISKKKAPPRDYKQGELQAIYNRALATVSGPRIPERKPIALCRDPSNIPTLTYLFFQGSLRGSDVFTPPICLPPDVDPENSEADQEEVEDLMIGSASPEPVALDPTSMDCDPPETTPPSSVSSVGPLSGSSSDTQDETPGPATPLQSESFAPLDNLDAFLGKHAVEDVDSFDSDGISVTGLEFGYPSP